MTGQDRRAQRRAGFFSLLAALAVLAIGGGVWFGVQAHALSGGNAALADPAATTEVAEEVGAAVKSIMSYNYRDLERPERAAERVLIGKAAEQYAAALDEVRELAEQEKWVRSTTVRTAGVRELRDDYAQVLVLVDQQMMEEGAETQKSTTAFFDIEAQQIGGSWKITSITAM